MSKQKIQNYGAQFVGGDLVCDCCNGVNCFSNIGMCDGINCFGKILKCNKCSSEIRQLYYYEEDKAKHSGYKVKFNFN